MQGCRDIVAESWPEASVYFNGGADINTHPDLLSKHTHLELEDLPTTWGGYDKFPLRARYLRWQGKAYLAMSGKFHTMWGEFGGFKHPDALRYEAAAMVAYGAGCSFGDQAHPSGKMDMDTYRNIGVAYDYVRQIEPYGIGAIPETNLALVAGLGPDQAPDALAHVEGVASMLLEAQRDFTAVESGDDLSGFQTVILPGSRFLTPATAAALNDYVRNGGSLLVLGESALAKDSDQLLFEIGGTYLGASNYAEDYLALGPELSQDLVKSPFLCYNAAMRVQVTTGQVLAAIHEPYFDRTYARYCSHQNTPNQLMPASHVGALQNQRIVFLPHALGKLYSEHGARLHRELFIRALSRLHTQPLLEAALSSCGRSTLVRQPEHNRHVVHLLYAPPLKRGRCLVIEDIPTLHRVEVRLRLREHIARAWLPVTGEQLPINRDADGRLHMVVPSLHMHQMIALDWSE